MSDTTTETDPLAVKYTVARTVTECTGAFFRRQGLTVKSKGRGRKVLGYLVPSVSVPGTWCYAAAGDKILTSSHGGKMTALLMLDLALAA